MSNRKDIDRIVREQKKDNYDNNNDDEAKFKKINANSKKISF